MLVPGLVLSGGASSRMGTPKATLKAGGTSFLARAAGSLLEGGCEEVVVVTGSHHAEIVAEVDTWPGTWPVRVVRNTTPGGDQLSSIGTGLDLLDHPGIHGVVIGLVDHPFVAAATVARLREAFARTGAPVVRPRFGGRHGHPVLFGRAAFDALRAPSPDGAKSVLRLFASTQVWVDVDDEGVILDVDTPDDYARAVERFGA